MVRFVSRPPSAALTPFVSHLWYFEGEDLTHHRERVLPSLGMQLLVNLDEDELRWWEGASLSVLHRARGAVLSGIYDRPFAIDTAEQKRIVGAVFRPGGAPAVVGAGADEIAGAHVELDALWGRDGSRLRERLLDAQDANGILLALDAWLSRRLRGEIDPVVRHACVSLEAGSSIRAIADDTGMSSKRLRRRFTTSVGVMPKGYARIVRFQRVLSVVTSMPASPRWAELAADLGYYDQAHLIHEFRDFSGLTPAAYRPRASDEQNHVVLEG